MKQSIKKDLRDALNFKRLFWVILGNTIYCLGIVAFILPLDLITGGTTGLGLILEHYFQIPIELFAAVFNVSMFILAWVLLGSSFAITTIVSTFYFPFILGVLQRFTFIQDLTTDPLLGTICAGLLIGIGIGVVIREGASTGGVDIPPLVLNKKFGLSVSVGLYACDFSILIVQMLFRDKEKTLYGILLVLIYTFVMEKVLVNGKSRIQVKIISDQCEEINTWIHTKLDRGSTFFWSESGYLRKEMKTLMTVVSKRELARLQQKVKEIDPEAFIVINDVKEVMGKGFSMKKTYDTKEAL